MTEVAVGMRFGRMRRIAGSLWVRDLRIAEVARTYAIATFSGTIALHVGRNDLADFHGVTFPQATT